MLPALPGLANTKQWSHSEKHGNVIREYVLSPIVCGGVSMEMAVKNDKFDDSHNAWLFSFRMEALFERPSNDELTWEVPASGKIIKRWQFQESDWTRFVASN